MDYHFSNTDVNISCITKTLYKSAFDDRDDAIRGGGIAMYYRRNLQWL